MPLSYGVNRRCQKNGMARYCFDDCYVAALGDFNLKNHITPNTHVRF